MVSYIPSIAWGWYYLGGGSRPRVPPPRYIWNQDSRSRSSLVKFFLRQKRDWVNNQSTRKHRTPRVIQKSKLLTSILERSQVLTVTVSDYYIFSEDGIYMYSRVPPYKRIREIFTCEIQNPRKFCILEIVKRKLQNRIIFV